MSKKIHRFIGQFDLSRDTIEIKDEDLVRQIRGVLRLEPGEQIILCDGAGDEAVMTITSTEKKVIVGDIIKRQVSKSEPERKVTLYLAVLKKENFELAVQKAVECGVSNIVPIITDRTVKMGINIERLQKIIIEASEQSGRGIIPELLPVTAFENAIVNTDAEEKLFFDPTGGNYTPRQQSTTVAIFIGPEGGFTEKEINLAKEYDFSISSLGPLILRGETGAVVATYRAVYGI